MSGFNFGTSTLGPTATGGGFSFGAAGSAPPAAGTGGFSFGGLGGATANPPANANTAANTNAAAANTTSSLVLGSGLFAQKPAAGFSFNTPASGAAAPSTGLALGTVAAAAPTATSTMGFGLGFGKPAASASPFSLGNTAISSTTTAPGATGLTLGSIITASAPQSLSSTGFSLNLGGGGVTSSVPGTGLSLGSSLFSSSALGLPNLGQQTLGMPTLGQPTLGQQTLGMPTLGQPTLGLPTLGLPTLGQSTLGQPTLGQPTLGLPTLGLPTLGQPTLGSALSSGGFLSSYTAPPAASMGLGGVDFSTSSEKKSDKLSGSRPEDSKALRDENLPVPICQDVDNFQKFVKEQKQVQEEISRMSYKAMLKVQDDIKSLKQLLSVSASGLQRNALSIDKLKMETAQELKNADIALRTQKTPPGLQHENTAPSDYFRTLVEQFEVQLQQYRQQIEELENHLTTQSSGSHITPQDLSMAMQKLYQTFVALAAQLQAVHENVKTLKHQYLSYRRAFLDDLTDVFESKRSASRKLQSGPRVTTGPTPFGSVPNAAAVAMAATLTQQQQPAPGFGSSNTSGFNFSNPGINASAGLTFGVSATQNTGFGTGVLQLKKPPAGNKRGKR